MIQPPDGIWGSKITLDNGTDSWRGMVRQLMEGAADVCGASLTVTEERGRVIDFSVGIVEDVVSVGMVNPAVAGGQGPNINVLVFLSIFEKAAWMAILGETLLSAIAFAIIALSKGDDQPSLLNISKNLVLGIYKFFLSLIQRNSNTGDKMGGLSSRILLLTMSALTFVLFTYYGGDLTATMTAGAEQTSLRSFQDILDSEYVLYTREGTAFYDQFQHAELGTVKKKIFDSKLVTLNSEQFFEKFLADPSSPAVYYGSGFSFVNRPERLFLGNFDDVMVGQLAYALQKNSDFREIFNYYIVKYMQTGTLRRLAHKWLKGDKPPDWSQRIYQEEATVLGYENLFFPMTVMLVGMVAGAIFLAVEKLHKKSKGESFVVTAE